MHACMHSFARSFIRSFIHSFALFVPRQSRQDTHLLLACDGVWDVLTEAEAIACLRSESDIHRAAARLRDLAFCRNSDDNISVVVVSLNKK